MPPFAKLLWQCRRGTAELDALLLRYLETEYLRAEPAEQARFVELLTWEDDRLSATLLGDQAVADPDVAALVVKLKRVGPISAA